MNGIHYVNKLTGEFQSIGLHSHDFWEVVYFTSGPGIALIDGKIEPFREKDVFIIPPNAIHKETCEVSYTNIHLCFINEGFHKTTFIRFHDNETNAFQTVLMQIYSEYHLKRKNHEAIIDCLLLLLFQYVESFSSEKAKHPYIGKIQDEIIMNISNSSFDLAKVLRDIPLNADYLRRFFVKEIGQTPMQYLQSKRLDHAKQLLASKARSDASIAEIAYQSGFDDISYFSKLFKKRTGYSPTKWANSSSQNYYTTYDEKDSAR